MKNVVVDSYGVGDVDHCVCDVEDDSYTDGDVDEVDCGGGR